jgi:hypothetical protein
MQRVKINVFAKTYIFNNTQQTNKQQTKIGSRDNEKIYDSSNTN